jgi:hypothetical protein
VLPQERAAQAEQLPLAHAPVWAWVHDCQVLPGLIYQLNSVAPKQTQLTESNS